MKNIDLLKYIKLWFPELNSLQIDRFRRAIKEAEQRDSKGTTRTIQALFLLCLVGSPFDIILLIPALTCIVILGVDWLRKKW